jgi:hypothetical protein
MEGPARTGRGWGHIRIVQRSSQRRIGDPRRGVAWKEGSSLLRVAGDGSGSAAVATSATDAATFVSVAVAGGLAGASGPVHSSEERIKRIHAAATRPRRSHFLLMAHAALSLSRAGSFMSNVRGIRITARRKAMVCSVSPVNSRKRLDNRLPERERPGRTSCRVTRRPSLVRLRAKAPSTERYGFSRSRPSVYGIKLKVESGFFLDAVRDKTKKPPGLSGGSSLKIGWQLS